MEHLSLERARTACYTLVATVAVLFLLQFVWSSLQFLSSIILLFFAAWLISFIFSPIAKLLQRWHLPPLLAVALVYVLLAVVLTGFIALAIPLISTQVNQIAERFTTLTTPDNLVKLNQQTVDFLKSIGISDHDAHRIIDQLTNSLQNAGLGLVGSLVANTTDLLSSLANILLDTVIALILSFYMMLDGRRIISNLIDLLPSDWQGDARTFQSEMRRVFGGFMRSQLIIGASYGVLTWLSLLALQIPGGFLVGLVCGILMIIPFIGPYLALVPALAITLVQVNPNDVVRTEIILLVVLIIMQQLVMQVLAPRVMSQGVGLHPLWLFAALLLGAKVAGVWGAFFAPPIAALIAVILDTLYRRFRRNNPLFDPIPDAADSPNGLAPAPLNELTPVAPPRETAP